MRVRHVVIQNFRGVRQLAWGLDARFACLIGPGDSGKSTILDAIALALSPRWNPSITDADFYDCDVTTPIRIEVTVSEPPRELLREDRFGHCLRGIAADGALTAEPDAKHEAGLTIRFEVDETLEPRWRVVRSDEDEGATISANARALMAVNRVGESAAPHLRWTKESALTQLGESTEVAGVLASAHRTARSAVFAQPADGLSAGAVAAGEAIKKLGAAELSDPRAGLDPSTGGRSARLVLHDGEVPATNLGLGSQRLAGIAFQLEALAAESVALIDEVELALEPHRLLHLLRHLRQRAHAGHGQVIISTHSPVVVEAVSATDLQIVRRDGDTVRVTAVPAAIEGLGDDLPQRTTRSGASAMLGTRIIVCEGPTEVGFCRTLLAHLDDETGTPHALIGTAVRDGGGSSAPERAQCLAELGFETALLIDHDLKGTDAATYNQRLEKAKAVGVEVIQWSEGLNTEGQLARSLPGAALRAMIDLAIKFNGSDDPEASVAATVANRLGEDVRLSGRDPAKWAAQSGATTADIRSAFGRAATERKWFKTEAGGMALGEIVATNAAEIPESTQLAAKLTHLRRFAYALPDDNDGAGA